ncbi:FAD dependent oxidoreductase domain-containing protein [Pochonia chlamydosporia 170]|uniref:FAD dependent oxidoreductase domain-containing protein n=1 Tax=Pochonia chlamydosporia 170 TaxID=1380566 RepID=A0A179FAW5_METCM|nr:FAD dependent oxidoreductase domain-containing protein [Pochonia chlamydosporia 170]OAQ62450.1 FAD dependent oxidoreductase domain-containing protein [Pochonia chlamydosporia 170]
MTVPKYSLPTGSTVIAIIGGGIAGCVQAICLAEEFPWLKILIFEKNKDILCGTSCMNPGRPTFGFHYRHLETATFCQDNTVNFTKFLERIGCRDIFARAPQKGIYVLMKDSVQILGESVDPVFSPHEIIPVFEQIKRHAIEKYQNDREFEKHFGRPDQICRQLQESEYESFLTPEVLKGVAACYETAERTFNTAGICSFLRGYVKKFKNITIHTGANVTYLERMEQSTRRNYRITWYDVREAEKRIDIAQLVTLACWENVGAFRRQLGKSDCEPTHNRLKMLAIVDINIEASLLQTIRPIFVASGPFCMISPQECNEQPDGHIRCRCACTLAIRTNIMTVPDNVPLPADYEEMLNRRISHEDRLNMAKPILEGAQQFFTCLKHARLADVRFGTVRVPYGGGNNMDLHDAASEHHKRNYPGCYRLGEGLYVNEAMKLIYSTYNAEKMVEWVRADILQGNGTKESIYCLPIDEIP